MRRMLLCTLLVFGFIPFTFSQFSSASDKVSVQTYDTKGLVKKFQLEGSDALLFDIPKYIEENDHLKRLIIRGSFKTDFSSTIVKFDSKNQEADYICSELETKYIPFIGVKASGRDDLNGVNIEKLVPTAPAAAAGITTSESIIEFNGQFINSVCDLKGAVMSTEIGDRVNLKMKKGTKLYSKYVVVGQKAVNTVNYKYCQEASLEYLPENNLEINTQDVSFKTYPNPTTSLSQVSFKSTSNEDVIFSVMDITGSLIHKEVVTNFDGNLRLEYNLESESDGVYILAIQQGNEVYKRKVQLIKL